MQNIFPIFTSMKEKIEHSNQIAPDTLKWIQDYNRDPTYLYRLAPEPERTKGQLTDAFKELKTQVVH